MTKNVYRRLLIAAMMLLIMASLIHTSPAQPFQTDCCADCEAVRTACRDEGGSRSYCNSVYWDCIRSCNGGVPEICP